MNQDQIERLLFVVALCGTNVLIGNWSLGLLAAFVLGWWVWLGGPEDGEPRPPSKPLFPTPQASKVNK